MLSNAQDANLKWRITVSVLLVAAFLAAGFWIFAKLSSLRKDPERVEQSIRRPAVRVVEIERGPFRELLTGYGRARALREAQVAAEIQGLIAWVSPLLEAGAAVKQGEELVRIDPRDLENSVARARADLDQTAARLAQTKVDNAGIEKRLAVARTELETSRQELARSESLVDDDIVSISEVDQQRRATRLLERTVLELESTVQGATTRVSRDQADVERAAALLAQAELDLTKASVRAPYTGRIAARHAQVGSRVAPGTLLFDIVDLSHVEVPVALPASRFGEVEVGSHASIRPTEDGPVVWKGTVARVSPVVGADDRTFEAFLVVESARQDSAIPPGAFVVATIEGRQFVDVMAVPRIAFVGDTIYVAVREAEREENATAIGLTWIWSYLLEHLRPRQEFNATASRRTPRIVRLLPDFALADGGIEPGDEVIVTNLERIANDARVTVTATQEQREGSRVGTTTENPEALGSSR